MNQRAGTRTILAGALVCFLAVPSLAQMEVQIGPGPVDPNATPGSPLNPRDSLLRPQRVRPDPVNPSMRSPPAPYPETLRPRTQIPGAGFTMTRRKNTGRNTSGPRKSSPHKIRPSKIDWRAQIHGNPPVAVAIDKPRDVPDRLLACWRPPGMPVQQEVTVRLGFNRDGKTIGEPRITYVGGALNEAHREALRRSILKVIADCTPLRFTRGLASAIAGRPFAIRFIAPAQKPSGNSI